MDDLNTNTLNSGLSLDKVTDKSGTVDKGLELKEIDRNIEMVVLYAIEHGIQYTSDFVQFLADDTYEESVEDVAEILKGFSEESAEYAFDKIDKKSDLAINIQALKDAIKHK
jgi:hypothetical protein